MKHLKSIIQNLFLTFYFLIFFSLNITAAAGGDRPPVSSDGNESIRVNNILTIDMSDHATDSDGSLARVTVTSAPSPDYTLNIIGTTILFDPTLNFEGNTSFEYFVTDNDDLDSNISTIYVAVVANNPPIAFDRNYTTFDTVPLVGNLITGTGQTTAVNTPDNDPDGDTLTISAYTQPNPAYGSLTMTIGGDGNFTFTPIPGSSGADANFTYTIDDGFGGTAEANVSIHLLSAQANLGISKTAPSSLLPGAAMSYTVTITSEAGAQFTDAQNVRMTDKLPSGFLFNGFVAPNGWKCGFVPGTITCDIATFSPGTSDILSINGFAPNAPGTIVNHANILSTTYETDTSNNDSNVSTTINAANIDMAIVKTATPNPAVTASLLTYTLEVTNQGTNDATGVVVKDRLDSGLLFVSVNGGEDWSCSQGSVISCDYIANGGVFVPGATPANIDINVTIPTSAGSINNSATVSSSSTDTYLSNNEANVTIVINDGIVTGRGVPLTKYLQYNLFGDMRLIGNANVNYSGTDPNQNYNDDVNMRYVDTDGIASTFNSSSSTLALADPAYNIIWVGLYWSGHVCSDSLYGTGDGSGSGCDWSNSNFTSFNQATTNANLGSIKLKTPKRASYIDITANTLNIIQENIIDWTYSAFADITNLIDNNETGTYTVADIVLSEGQFSDGGNYGGWAMLVIYEDDNKTLHYKNISIFNGFQRITTNDNPLQIDGFLTPLSGDVTASIAFFAGDGDPVPGGVARMRQGNTNTFSAIGSVTGNANSPATNLFNSTVGEFGQAINTGVLKTYGVDADRINVSSFMENGQTDTEFRLDVTTPSGGVDYYNISLFAFATDLTTPIIDNFTKSAEIIDANGTIRVASPNELIYPGNELRYTLVFTNTGDEVAEQIEILDDFDFDGLTPALDLSNFDISKTHLYDSSNNEIPNTCGYNALENRVYCRLASVAVGATYTMQFSVTVKSSFTSDVLDKNATNTAYAKYKNPNGDSYVIDINVEGEDFGGNSNTFNAGIFALRDPRSQSFIYLDAINNNYTYNQDKNITTKIVNEPFNIKLVHIDRAGNNSGYSQWPGRAMPVILSLTSDQNTLLVSDPGTIQFTQGVSEVIANNITIPIAFRNDTLQMGYLDWATILAWAPPNSPCITDTSSSVKLKGLPACFNQLIYAQDVFSLTSFPDVTNICYGQGGTLPAGSNFACDTASYGAGSVASGNISPSKYNHPYGCYHCITDAFVEFRHSSSDAFATRPKNFQLSSTNNSFPDLLRSGNEYNLTVRALDGTSPTPELTAGYTRAKFISTEVNSTKYTAAGIISTVLHGTVSTTLSNDYNITDGISTLTTGTGTDVVGISYDDVGKINIQIQDSSWAFVDWDDTPRDCTTTVNSNGITIEASAYICGDINATFIPSHFTVSNINLNNHRDGNFTYLSNDLNMSAHVGVQIDAKNTADAITQNFQAGAEYYENPMTVAMTLPVNPHPTNNTANIKDIPNPKPLGFGGTDGNGTRIITSAETNTSQQLMFNFARTNDAPVNPFDYNGSDVNISVQSTYTGSALEGTATITGNAVGVVADKAHFFYARVRPSKQLYNNVDTASKPTPLLLQIYCNSWPAVCPELANITYLNTSDNDWKINTDHNATSNDGNITLTSPPNKLSGGSGNNPTVTTAVNITSQGRQDAVTVTRGGTADLPMELGINLDTTTSTNTNSWLIFNPSSAVADPIPFYRVKFIGTSGWTGHGKTGNVVDANASKQINNRLGW